MSIPVERYFDPSSLDEEWKQIFWRRCFIAHESDIASSDEYFSFRLGRRNLTLRRFDSNIALLDNVCRHRFNLIDPPGFGVKPFRCGYHGWTYDSGGEIAHVPFREDFQEVPRPLERHDHWNHQGFVFGGGASLATEDALGALLADGGRPDGAPFHRGTLHHQCNWKLIVENVLEAYHLSAVHPKTFVRSGFTASSRSEIVIEGIGSKLVVFPHERVAEPLAEMFPGIVPSYSHGYLFPNLFVSCTNGLIDFVSNVLPVSADQALLHYRLFANRRCQQLKPAVLQYLKEESVKFTEAALAEDKAILENCQLGMLSAAGAYTLGAREKRIDAFHKIYMDRICA